MPRKVRDSDFQASRDKVIQGLKQLWPNLDTRKAMLHVVQVPHKQEDQDRIVGGYNLALPHGSVEVDLILEKGGIDESTQHWALSLARVYHFCDAPHLHKIALIRADGTIITETYSCEHTLLDPNG